MSVLVAANLNQLSLIHFPFSSDIIMYTSFVEQTPLLEATNVFARQILYILWNPEFHFHVHKSLPLVPVIRQRSY
jgi:hypothetical protein